MLCICHPKEAFQIMLVFFSSCYSSFICRSKIVFIRRQNCNMLCICHPKEAFQIMLVFFSCYSYSFADKIVICCVYVTLRKHFRSCWYFFFLLFIFTGKIVMCCVYVTLRKHFRSCWYFFLVIHFFKIVICCYSYSYFFFLHLQAKL